MLPYTTNTMETLRSVTNIDSSSTLQIVDAIKFLKETTPQWYKEDWVITLGGVVIGALITGLFTYFANKRQYRNDKEKSRHDLIHQLISIRANAEGKINYLKDCADTYLLSFSYIRSAVGDNQYQANATFNIAKNEYSKSISEFIKDCSLFTGLIDDDKEIKDLMKNAIYFRVSPDKATMRVGIDIGLIDGIIKKVIDLMEVKINDLRK